MTTIAWDGKTVAADSLGCCGGDRHQNPFKKLIKLCAGRVIGFTGDVGMQRHWIDWLESGADPFHTPFTRLLASQPGAKIDPGSLLVFQRGKNAVRFLHNRPFPVEFGAPEAFGSGAEYAVGAMDAGLNAHAALVIAAKRNVYTGGEIQVIEL